MHLSSCDLDLLTFASKSCETVGIYSDMNLPGVVKICRIIFEISPKGIVVTYLGLMTLTS